MFPATITIHNAQQLHAVQIALLGNDPAQVGTLGASGQNTAKATAARPKTDDANLQPAASAGAASQASTAATGDAGNAAKAAGPAAAATPASSTTPSASPAVSFDVVKKAFLALSTKPGGRGLCMGVLKPFGIGKLSEAKEAQYAEIHAAIDAAAA